MCISLCPTDIFELSDELNMRIAYIPQVKGGKGKYCTGCRRCEYGCPDWCIYVLDKEEFKTKKAKTQRGESNKCLKKMLKDIWQKANML